MWPSPEVHSMTSSQNTKWPWMNWIKSQGGRKLGHRRRCGVGTSQCWKHFSLLLSSKFLLAIVATWSGPTLAWMTLWFKICRSQVLFLSCYAQKLLVQFWIGYICAAPAVFRRLVVIVLLGAVFRRLLVLHRQRQSIWRKPCAQTPDSSTAWLFWGPRLQFQRFGWHHVYIVAGTYWWDGHTTTWPWGGLCILCIPLSTLKTKKHSHAVSLEVPEFQQLPVVLCRTTAMVKQTRHLTCSRKMISVTSLMTSQWSKLARRSKKRYI